MRCATEFVPRSGRALTCSPKCSRDHHNAQERALRAANRDHVNARQRALRAANREPRNARRRRRRSQMANRMPTEARACVFCGKPVIGRAHNAKTCSPDCSRDHHNALYRARYAANGRPYPPHRNAQVRAWYAANRDHRNAQHRAWRAADLEARLLAVELQTLGWLPEEDCSAMSARELVALAAHALAEEATKAGRDGNALIRALLGESNEDTATNSD